MTDESNNCSQKQRCMPEDAKRLWEALESKGIKVNDGKVAAEIRRSGRFLPVDRSTVARWRKSRWRAFKPSGPGPKTSRVIQSMEAAHPKEYAVLMETFKESVADLIGRYTDLGEMGMMRAAARHCYANAMILSSLLQERRDDPDLDLNDAGRMAKAIAESVKSANEAMAILVNMSDELVKSLKLIDGEVVDPSEASADTEVCDHYGDVFAPFKPPH